MISKLKKNTEILRLGLVSGMLMILCPSIASAGPSFQVGEEGTMDINYSLQIWMQQRGFRSSDNSGDSFDTFLRRNRLTFFGQYNDWVSYFAQIDAGGDSRYGNDNRSVFYRDAYVTLDYSDPIRFIAGRFKNTFSRENLEGCFDQLTIDRAEVIAYTPFGGTRDTGAAMWGNLADAQFQYRIMIADGREGDEVAKDSPRVTVRGHWSPLDPEYGYGYQGSYLGTKEVFTLGVAFDQQANIAYADAVVKTGMVDYTAKTVDFFYEKPTKIGTFTLTGAYMEYGAEDAINNPNHDASLPVTTELKGSLFKGAYLFPDKIGIGRLQLYTRFEASDYKYTATNLDQIWTGLGANYYIDGQRLKATFELSKITFDEESLTNARLQDYTQATLGLQIVF